MFDWVLNTSVCSCPGTFYEILGKEISGGKILEELRNEF